MIYVTGGINGNFESYRDMLDKLSLKETDALFVLGNVIDNGKNGIKILKDMMFRSNIYPILGKHEYMAKNLLSILKDASGTEECVSLLPDGSKVMFSDWLKDGGYPTLEEFLKLDAEERDSVLDYLEEFAAYDEVEVGGRKFILVGSGIGNFSEEKDLDEYSEEDFVLENADYTKIYFKDKFLITGGTPTYEIAGGKSGKIFSAKRHLAVNCSSPNDGKVASVCLDTMKVYYV